MPLKVVFMATTRTRSSCGTAQRIAVDKVTGKCQVSVLDTLIHIGINGSAQEADNSLNYGRVPTCGSYGFRSLAVAKNEVG